MPDRLDRVFYAVITVIAVLVAGGVGYYAGVSSVSGTTATVTITRPFTVTQPAVTYTIQTPVTQQTTQTPSQEQLLAPIIEAAKREGKLVIYSTLDRASAEPLLNAFKTKYPFIDVQYVELNTVALYNRYISERAAGAPTADMLLSTGFDLQYMLVLNGSAQPYRLTVYDTIPDVAKYKDLAYVPYYALIAPIYNTMKIPREYAPKSYSDLLRLLTEKRDLFPPRSITVFDISGSAIALTFTYYLYKAEPDLVQRIFSAAGSIGVTLYTATGPQIEVVKTGQAFVSISLIANYAFREARNDPRVGVFVPSDVVVLVPATVFITREASHPNAAKLFLEFMFSREGQLRLAETANVIVVGDNPVYPELSLKYLYTNVKKLVVPKFGDLIIDELLKSDVRSSFIAMWKKWLGIG